MAEAEARVEQQSVGPRRAPTARAPRRAATRRRGRARRRTPRPSGSAARAARASAGLDLLLAVDRRPPLCRVLRRRRRRRAALRRRGPGGARATPPWHLEQLVRGQRRDVWRGVLVVAQFCSASARVAASPSSRLAYASARSPGRSCAWSYTTRERAQRTTLTSGSGLVVASGRKGASAVASSSGARRSWRAAGRRRGRRVGRRAGRIFVVVAFLEPDRSPAGATAAQSSVGIEASAPQHGHSDVARRRLQQAESYLEAFEGVEGKSMRDKLQNIVVTS